MKKIILITTCFAFFFPYALKAQGYQALHGSGLTGSTAVFNNPAASVTSAYKWDLTLFSAQVKLSNNSMYLKNFPSTSSTELTMKEGFQSRFLHTNLDVSLLNFLYKIDNEHAVNFGIRARTYSHIKTMPFQYSDSIFSPHSFFIANRATPYLQGFGTHTGWLEADLNYSQVLFENSNSKLSGGLTLQIMKGLSGAYVKVNKITYLESKSATDTSFVFTGGGGAMAYSANYDESSFKDVYKKSLGALGLSVGIEYMTYNTDANAYGNNNLNYDWKIGLSLMDLGANSFTPSIASGQYYNPVANVSDADLDAKLSYVRDTKEFRDSLSTIFAANADITDNYRISNPTRLILNIDKNFGRNLYVNGELSMNFYSTSNYAKLRTRELNLLTITPRWETVGLGAYLPIQYNTQGQLWVGLAIKAGPLVVGFHDLGLLFKKDPYVNGGGYLLLSIHPFSRKKIIGKMDCPE
ncbi:MAG: hypothetical protein V4539_03450 [Bacteroidota bacterium]